MKKRNLLLIRAVLLFVITIATLGVSVFAWFINSDVARSGDQTIGVISVNDIECTFYRSQDNVTYTKTEDPLNFVDEDFIPGKVIYTRIDLKNVQSNNVVIGLRALNASLTLGGTKPSANAAADFNNNVKILYAVRDSNATDSTPPSVTQPVDVYDEDNNANLTIEGVTVLDFISGLNATTIDNGSGGYYVLCPSVINVYGNSTTSVYLFYAFDRDFTGLYDSNGTPERYDTLALSVRTLQLFA